MVPLRFVFRSRWWALAWAAGLCWSAMEFAGGRGHDAAANAADPQGEANDMDAVAAALSR